MFTKQSRRKVEHIWSLDPALDRDHPDFDSVRWVETGDARFLPRKASASPVVFYVEPLTGTARELAKLELQRASERPDRLALCYFALARLGVVGARDARYDDGSPIDIRWTTTDPEDGVRVLTEDALALLHSADATEDTPAGAGTLLYELGARVFRETFGDPTSRKG